MTQDKVPPQIQLRYRIQGKHESLFEFGDAIRTLGTHIFDGECERNSTVIESFWIGLQNTDLSAKMLQKTFISLGQAIEYADQRNQNQSIRKFISEHRSNASTSNPMELEVLPIKREQYEQSKQPCTSKQNETRLSQPPRKFNDGPHTRHHTFEPRRETRACFYCGKIGHLQAVCYKRLRDMQVPKSQSLVCQKCHKRGHCESNCRANLPYQYRVVLVPRRVIKEGKRVKTRYLSRVYKAFVLFTILHQEMLKT